MHRPKPLRPPDRSTDSLVRASQEVATRGQGCPHSIHFAAGAGRPETSAFSSLNGSPLSTVTVTFFNWTPFALRISKLFAAEIFTFSKTTLEMPLSGKPTIVPADFGHEIGR